MRWLPTQRRFGHAKVVTQNCTFYTGVELPLHSPLHFGEILYYIFGRRGVIS